MTVPPASDEGLFLTIDHVGLAVPDLDAAVAFHTEVLGLTLRHREENDDQDIAEALLSGSGLSGSGMSGSSGGDDPVTEVQLVAPRSPTSVLAAFLDRTGPGLHHVAYRVADVDVAAQILRHRGLRLLYDRGRQGTRGSRINFVHPKDAGGVLIELVERAGPDR